MLQLKSIDQIYIFKLLFVVFSVARKHWDYSFLVFAKRLAHKAQQVFVLSSMEERQIKVEDLLFQDQLRTQILYSVAHRGKASYSCIAG